jgi:predicted nucleic acid-binding protein
MRFWDSSALVPLVVRQVGWEAAERWVEEDSDVAAWVLTDVEVQSAIRRLAREGALSEAEASSAEGQARALRNALYLVTDVEWVRAQAHRLLRLHTLRAADALQLAAALAWADGDLSGRILHTFDRRLGLAATREGFGVVPEP